MRYSKLYVMYKREREREATQLYAIMKNDIASLHLSNLLVSKNILTCSSGYTSWCLVVVERLFLAVPWGCLRFVIMVFHDHTHLLFLL